jgi:PKD repeat protein
LSTTATGSSPVGSYAIDVTAGTLQATNYVFHCVGGTLTITEATVALAVTILTPDSGDLQQVGQAIGFAGSFTLSAGVSSGYSAQWTFSSVMPASQTVVAGVISGTSVSLTRAFAAAGIYSVTLTVTDPNGVAVSTSVVGGDPDADAFVVIYDPNGGFVTGGGWIWSPQGAYTLNPSVEGRANFGFVSKYKKGANLPEGNTEFQFNAGGLNFHSSAYQWLVVAGTRAQFKGVGAINGTPDFGFLLTVTDGDPKKSQSDQFRIKIWDLISGQTIYDNQIESDDDAVLDLATNLRGGAINIQTK